MSHKTKPYWFPAKRYGWGWGLPVVWQGWGVLILFIATVSILALVIDPNENLVTFLVTTLVAAGVLLGICYAKGEPPSWRWGSAREEQNKEPKQDADPHV